MSGRSSEVLGEGRDTSSGLGSMVMAQIVLRVRLTSGAQLDVMYEDAAAADQDEVIEQVVSTLAEANGVLRCRHGGRLMVLYARGVAAVEVGPAGAVL